MKDYFEEKGYFVEGCMDDIEDLHMNKEDFIDLMKKIFGKWMTSKDPNTLTD